MAQLGFRKLDEMVGRVDCLVQRRDVDHWKASGLDFPPCFTIRTCPHAWAGTAPPGRTMGSSKRST
jgi:hypothetical protein